MADHQDKALVFHQEVLQPLDGLQVQMVGGLVQQNDVGLAEEGLGQHHLHLFLGCQAGHLAVEQIQTQPQALNQAPGVGLRLPAVHIGKLRLQLRGPDAILVGEVLLLVEGILLLHDLIQSGVALDNGIQHGELVELEVVLLQHGHPLILGDDDLTGGGLQIAGEDAKEGGLPRSVGADDTVAVAGDKFQVHVLEQRLSAEVQTDVVDSDHV